MPRGGVRESCSLGTFLVRIGVKGRNSLGCIYRVVESFQVMHVPCPRSDSAVVENWSTRWTDRHSRLQKESKYRRFDKFAKTEGVPPGKP